MKINLLLSLSYQFSRGVEDDFVLMASIQIPAPVFFIFGDVWIIPLIYDACISVVTHAHFSKTDLMNGIKLKELTDNSFDIRIHCVSK
jgi:hypothetical protein